MCYTLEQLKMEENTLQNNIAEHFKAPTKKRSPFIAILLLIVILFAVGFGAIKILDFTKAEGQAAEVTPSPTISMVEELPTETPVESTPTEEPTKTPSVKPTINPIDKSSGLDRSDLAVEVKNGSGESMVGSKGSEVLKGFGYHVVAVGNADNFNYENTTINIKESKSSFLSLLKKDLSSVYTIGSSSATLSASSSADAVVIIGKQ